MSWNDGNIDVEGSAMVSNHGHGHYLAAFLGFAVCCALFYGYVAFRP